MTAITTLQQIAAELQGFNVANQDFRSQWVSYVKSQRTLGILNEFATCKLNGKTTAMYADLAKIIRLVSDRIEELTPTVVAQSTPTPKVVTIGRTRKTKLKFPKQKLPAPIGYGK